MSDTFACYLNDEAGYYEHGVRRRLTPTPLAAVCGTYDMLYPQDPEYDADDRNGPYEADDFFTLAPSDPKKKVGALKPQDIVGSFKTGVLTGEVVELKRTRGIEPIRCGCAGHIEQAKPILAADGYMTSAWEMAFEWDGGEEEGHMLVVSTVRDDNGNPFVEVRFFHGYSGCAAHRVSIIGKKRVAKDEEEEEDEEVDEDANEEDGWPRLSKAEMWRLGVGVDHDELALRLDKREARIKAAKAKAGKGKKGKAAKVADDEEEYGKMPEFSDGEDGESGEGSEGEEESEEESEEEAPPSGKRPASASWGPASKRRKTTS